MARERKEDFNALLAQYAIERYLYRLSRSSVSSRFVLKGAMLFRIWASDLHRPTKDLDLLGFGDASPDSVAAVVREIIQTPVEEDGVVFDSSSVHASEIRENQGYRGVRVKLLASLDGVPIPVQLDIGFGDAIVPDPKSEQFPTLLDFPAPRLRVYPRESVVAEKLQAIVVLGIANSRMKDFYDLWTLSRGFEFDGETLARAIRATFERRGTPLPHGVPLGLTAEFAADATKQTQWKAFLTRLAIEDTPVDLGVVIDEIRGFLVPAIQSAVDDSEIRFTWPPGGPWSDTSR